MAAKVPMPTPTILPEATMPMQQVMATLVMSMRFLPKPRLRLHRSPTTLAQTIGWIGDQLHIDAHGNADAGHYDGDDQHDKTCRKRWIRQSQTLQEKVKTCIKELQEQAEGHGKRQLQPVGPLSGFSFQKDFDQCKRCIHQERQKGEVEVPDL